MKRQWLGILCLLLLFLLTSCATVANPLAHAQSTPVPGLPEMVIATASPMEAAEQMDLTLFFRYRQTGLLASETRTIAIPNDESAELTAIRQLLAGPQASHADLERLFPHNTTVVNVVPAGDVLMVTLSEGFLNDGIPAQWADDPAWKHEAPLRRKLTIQSLVATLTENFPYASVQVFIAREQQSNISTRLDSSYFLDGRTGPCDLLMRDESLLLTMQNTALTILDAWQSKDLEQLYLFTASELPADPRPDYQLFVEALDTGFNLLSYTASAGHSPHGSDLATMTLSLTLLQDQQELTRPAVPLRLVWENCTWKVPYSELMRLLLPSD